MAAVNYMTAFLQHKEELDEVERKGAYTAGEESYEEEFRTLRELSQSYKAENVYPSVEAMKSCNVPRNRFKDIVPFDYTRVKLKTVEGASTNDYINASFIKGAIGDQKYIAAQGPLPKTVSDFWQMLWENDVRVVLMVCREYEGQPPKLKCQRYWPNSTTEELLFGNIRVTLEEVEKTSYKEHLIRHMVARVDGISRKIIQFHYMDWPDAGVPRCIPGILELIERLRAVQPLDAKETPPVLFHCSAGCGRTGTMIVIDFVISLLKYGKLTEDFTLYNVIVELRRQRMAIVQSLEQYVFVHEVIATLFKRQTIDGHIYDNVPSSSAKPKQQEPYYDNMSNTGIYDIPQNNGPVKSNSLKDTTKPTIIPRKQRLTSDANTEPAAEKSLIDVSYVLSQAVQIKPQPSTLLTSSAPRKAGTGEVKSGISPKLKSKNNAPNDVPCVYELAGAETEDSMKVTPVEYEVVSDYPSSSSKVTSPGLGNPVGSRVEPLYEVIVQGPIGGDTGKPPHPRQPKVSANYNAPIIYKGINISFPHRLSKKPRGKRENKHAWATAKAL